MKRNNLAIFATLLMLSSVRTETPRLKGVKQLAAEWEDISRKEKEAKIEKIYTDEKLKKEIPELLKDLEENAGVIAQRIEKVRNQELKDSLITRIIDTFLTLDEDKKQKITAAVRAAKTERGELLAELETYTELSEESEQLEIGQEKISKQIERLLNAYKEEIGLKAYGQELLIEELIKQITDQKKQAKYTNLLSQYKKKVPQTRPTLHPQLTPTKPLKPPSHPAAPASDTASGTMRIGEGAGDEPVFGQP